MKIGPLIVGVISFFLVQGALAQSPQEVSDGPYIFYEEEEVVARWVEKGKLKEVLLDSEQELRIPSAVSPSFRGKYLRPDTTFAPDRKISFEGVERVLAVSDIHGQYELLLQLLETHRVVDEAGDWNFGKGHLVVLGDIFDRGDGVTELLWLVHKLEQQAKQAGGRVHYLLGNHEVMALQGDLRYVNRKYRYTMAATTMSYEELFGEDTYLGRWIRSKPAVISINGVAYVHAGISEEVLQQGLSFQDINEAFQQRILREDEATILADPVLRLLYTEEGPMWYRGYFEKDFKKRQAKRILRQIGMKRMVIGHTSFEEILSLFRGKIYCIDSSIKLGEDGEVLLVEGGKFYTCNLAGEKRRLR